MQASTPSSLSSRHSADSMQPTALSDQWMSHKQTIYNLYVVQRKPLKYVRQYLQEYSSFAASESQYKRKLNEWEFAKNHKAAQWKGVGTTLQRRRLDHTNAVAVVQGTAVSPRRLQRALRRHHLPTLSLKNKKETLTSTPEGVAIQRILPVPSALSSSKLPGFVFLEDIRKQAFQMRHLSIPDSFLGVRHALLGYNGFSATEQEKARIVSKFVASFPSQEPDLVSQQVNSLLCKPVMDNLPVLASYAIYLCSNNLLDNVAFYSFMDYLLENSATRFLRCLPRLDTLTSRSFRDRVLLYAAMTGYYDLVGFMQPSTADLSKPIIKGWDSRTALQMALVLKNEDFCRRLIDDGVDLSISCSRDFAYPPYQQTLTLVANHIPGLFATVIDRIPDFNCRQVLPLAVKAGMDIDGIKGLLERGADVDALDDRFQTALCYSIRSENLPLIELLLARGASPNGPGAEARITHWAHFENDNLDKVSHILLPLRLAVECENKDICNALLRCGADVNADIYGSCRYDGKFGESDIQDESDESDTHGDEGLGADLVFRLAKMGYTISKADFPNVLAVAIAEGLSDMVELLLEAGANLKAKSPCETAPLMIAAYKGNLAAAELLLKYGADVNELSLYRGKRVFQTALQAASANGDLELLAVLISADADVNAPAAADAGRTALQHAAEEGHVAAVTLLLQHGAKVNAPPAIASGLTALQAAILHSNEEVELVDLLLQHGADVNEWPAGRDSFAALACAIRCSSITLFWKFIKHGADINLGDVQNHPLLVASRKGGKEFISILLSLQVNLSIRLGSGKTVGEAALFEAVIALRNGYESAHEAICLLLDHIPHVPLSTLNWIITKVRPSSPMGLTLMQILLHRGARVDSQDHGDTILGNAVQCNNLPAVLYLLQHKADPNVFVHSFFTHGPLLTLAVEKGNLAMIEVLLQYNANPNPALERVTTPLQWACEIGNIEIAELLLKHGADVNADVAKVTALQAACERGDLQLAELLLKDGADVNADAAALQAACKRGDLQLAELLLKHSADVNADAAALQAACKRGDLQLAELLLKHGADVNADVAKVTALQAACERGDLQLAELLLKHGADVNAAASEFCGFTALQAAAIKGHLRIAQSLIAAGADVGAAASLESGRTAINGAAEHGRLDMAKLLLDHYHLKDGESFSGICDEAAEYARKEYHWAVAALLETYQREPCWSP